MEPITGVGLPLVAKGADAAIEVGRKEARSFLAKVLGPPAETIGELLAIWPRERLFNNMINVVLRANKKLKEAGVDPRQVPLKIIHPLLENAALEEDDGIRERWANLLANNADPRNPSPPAASYADILKDLGTREVKFLDAVRSEYDRHTFFSPDRWLGPGNSFGRDSLLKIYASAGLSRTVPQGAPFTRFEGREGEADLEEFAKMMNVLEKHRLFEKYFSNTPIEASEFRSDIEEAGGREIYVGTHVSYRVTGLGLAFIEACQPPRA